MIYKKRSQSVLMKKLEVLVARLPLNHDRRQEIEAYLARHTAGYQGEVTTDYYFQFLNERSYILLHDIRLPFKDTYFQMDTLILTATFILIIEVKNIAGSLTFDHEHNQVIRTCGLKEDVFHDPVLQVERQKRQLHDWLEKMKFPTPPIHTLVVLSREKMIIKNDFKQRLSKKVIRAALLPTKIEELMKKETQPFCTESDLKKLARKFVKEHVPYCPDVLRMFTIAPHEILPGVSCLACSAKPMIRLHARWQCTACGIKSHTAHSKALYEYTLLFGKWIDNKSARNFLKIESRDATRRILQKYSQTQKGSGNFIEYELSHLES
ncbi:nerd domain-containing protein [Fictibacillus macauensis ZFHKF-1]|uniref:Nerd domain-containing protein n=1 Tax=Fictibacillus macauensis ZFHKF-1 TaxID=1196324 RepID=I8UHC6_9BACL|nr:nuclease-related domain-containing protein [Fictibacillus macauensis]EIT86228.1 nerd domain-containing protein [Fictibacillus macauensis ZFHKF-1]